MFQLKILTGKRAGHIAVARRFPFLVGRATGLDLTLEEPGVWERHGQIDFCPGEGIQLMAEGDALVAVNGSPVKTVILHNGDLMDMGGVKLQFWLAAARQANQRLHACLIWGGLALFLLLQAALVWHFLD